MHGARLSSMPRQALRSSKLKLPKDDFRVGVGRLNYAALRIELTDISRVLAIAAHENHVDAQPRISQLSTLQRPGPVPPSIVRRLAESIDDRIVIVSRAELNIRLQDRSVADASRRSLK